MDFSAASLEKARALGTRCGVEVEWVHADVTRLPAALKQRFDLVYATIGVLSWIETSVLGCTRLHRHYAPAGDLPWSIFIRCIR
ncbi:MAG TPA: class I SAM-dependent methyltransferase [Solirubrobacteraceae bacterium]|nr:class I SAM-dependent methyltransferase [Solirubrobacteraceae bacterium]